MQRGRTSFAQEDELPDPDSGVYCQLRGVGAYPGERDTVECAYFLSFLDVHENVMIAIT